MEFLEDVNWVGFGIIFAAITISFFVLFKYQAEAMNRQLKLIMGVAYFAMIPITMFFCKDR